MTRDVRKRFMMFIVVYASLPLVGHSQRLPVGDVSGYVRVDGALAQRVPVQLQRLGITVQEEFASEGLFTFKNVPDGAYTLSIRVDGQEPAIHRISVPGDTYVAIEIRTSTRLPVKAAISVFELQTSRSARREYERGRDRVKKGDCAEAL